MINIDPPQHISQLNLVPNHSGIYIWGFVYCKAQKTALDFSTCILEELKFDTNSHQFIPYYVGEASDLKSRLGQHSLIRSMHAGKYTRFKTNYQFWQYIPRQYKGGFFDKKYNRIAQFLQYYAEMNIMLSIYTAANHQEKIKQKFSSNKRQPSITDLETFLGIRDTLEDVVHSKDNFWFMTLSNSNVPMGANPVNFNDENTRHEYENLIYLSLKGGTVSRCIRNKVNRNIRVHDSSTTGVFHLNQANELVHHLKPIGNIDPNTFDEINRTPYW